MLLRVAAIHLLALTVVFGVAANEPRQIRETGSVFVGSSGCKSSSCHGGAGPKRSQYITWSQKDFHTKAYAILLDARSTRIAQTLQIAEPATNAPACTVCHSPFQSVAPNRITHMEHSDEGVSCETCHGAAGGWLRGHTRPDWTYNTRVAAGMRDLRNIYVRANACVACHQYLEPKLLHAGHPDLFFELDGQSVAEPKHWPKGEPWSGLREWLTGQAVALREMSWALASEPQTDEFSNARWDGLAWLCATATAAASIPSPVTQPPSAPTRSDFTSMQMQADALARRASNSNWSDSSARSLLASLASTDAEFTPKGTANQLLGQRAKRLVLALDRLAHALGQSRGARLKIDAELNQLFQDVRTLDAFDAIGFAAHLQAFRAALDKSG
ncbi:MAG TPA: multiheme c-type cytochrome [Chthoniobacterales bacterium]|nr:multiheme c-type cytochrome [Chthoniobacterales bacterium]